MDSRFGFVQGRRRRYVTRLRMWNEYADIDTMSDAAVKKELKEHGIEVVA